MCQLTADILFRVDKSDLDYIKFLNLLPRRWRQYVPLKRRCTSIRLYGVTFQKTVILKFQPIASENVPCLTCRMPFMLDHRPLKE
jgi:hypothetical protein